MSPARHVQRDVVEVQVSKDKVVAWLQEMFPDLITDDHTLMNVMEGTGAATEMLTFTLEDYHQWYEGNE